MNVSEMIPPRVRTVVYNVALVVGLVLTLGWDLLGDWIGGDVVGRIASVVTLVTGALGVAYRPTRPGQGQFQAGEAGGTMFEEADEEAATPADLEHREEGDLAAKE